MLPTQTTVGIVAQNIDRNTWKYVYYSNKISCKRFHRQRTSACKTSSLKFHAKLVGQTGLSIVHSTVATPGSVSLGSLIFIPNLWANIHMYQFY